MADVYRAFQVLNESLQLNLTNDQIARAEMVMKERWANKFGYKEFKDPNDWEFFSYLVPRDATKKHVFPPEEL